jgi:hypothetical protein
MLASRQTHCKSLIEAMCDSATYRCSFEVCSILLPNLVCNVGHQEQCYATASIGRANEQGNNFAPLSYTEVKKAANLFLTFYGEKAQDNLCFFFPEKNREGNFFFCV